MAPLVFRLFNRSFDPQLPSDELSDQWKNPGDVFSVLLILGGDVVARALAQLAGSRFTPVTFSFGKRCQYLQLQLGLETYTYHCFLRMGCLRCHGRRLRSRREQVDAAP